MYVFIHVLVSNQDIIYYGCYFHSHIGTNKLFRKIVFTDMAIRVMPERINYYYGVGSLRTKKLGRNISGLALCVKKIRDVILRAWHSKGYYQNTLIYQYIINYKHQQVRRSSVGSFDMKKVLCQFFG